MCITFVNTSYIVKILFVLLLSSQIVKRDNLSKRLFTFGPAQYAKGKIEKNLKNKLK